MLPHIVCQFDCLVVLFEGDTIIWQVVVETGRRRAPQHLALHYAWHINIATYCLQHFVVLQHQRFKNPLMIFLYARTYRIDGLHHRALFLVSCDIHVLF